MAIQLSEQRIEPRDADWQQRVAAFARVNGMLHDPVTHTLDLISEVGEVAKEILRASEYGHHQPIPSPELAAELGDALYSLLALAEVCEVDAGQALEAALEKYSARLRQKGDAGSQDDS